MYNKMIKSKIKIHLTSEFEFKNSKNSKIF